MMRGRKQKGRQPVAGNNFPQCVNLNETSKDNTKNKNIARVSFRLVDEYHDGNSDDSDETLYEKGDCNAHKRNSFKGEDAGEQYTENQMLQMMLGESCECNDFISGTPTQTKMMWSGIMYLDQISSVLKKFVTDPNQTELRPKLCKLWKQYLKKSPAGVHFKEFPSMMDIFYTLNDNYTDSEFANVLLDMMTRHLKKMLQYRILSDFLDLHYLTNAFISMGNLIIHGNIKIQSQLVEIFLYWIERYEVDNLESPPRNWKNECNPAMINVKTLPKENFMSAVEKSSLPRLLSKAIIDKTLNDGAYINILEILKFVCENSQIICGRMIRRPILEPVLEKLDSNDDTCVLLSRTVDFIYALFSKSNESFLKQESRSFERAIPYPGTHSVHKLLVRFVELLHWSESKFLVQLRNDVAFSIFLLTKHIYALRRHFSAFASYICEIVSANILDKNANKIHIQLDVTQEGLELLKHLVALIGIIISSSFAKKLIYDFQLVPVFMRIIQGPCRFLEGVSKDNNELNQLIEVAWQCLSVVAKVEPLAFDDPEGAQSMLALLHVYGKNGTVDKTLLYKFTHILRMMLSHKHEATMKIIGDHFSVLNAIAIFVDALKQITVNKFTIAEEPVVCNILLSIASLCEHDDSKKEIFCASKGVRVVTRFMIQLVLHPAKDRHMNPLLHISVAECVWKCIAFSTSALEMFIAYEGVLVMLDLIEIAAGPSAILCMLNCLLDLCEYSRCMDQLLHWKRTTKRFTKRHSHHEQFNQTLTQGLIFQALQPAAGDQIGDYIVSRDETLAALFCELWRDEEKRLGVLRDSEGCIASIEKPLMGEFARNFTSLWKLSTSDNIGIKPSEFPGASCLDLMASIRPKIHLLVKNIIAATNTEATIFGGLSVKNQVTMQIIINFLDLKRGELWVEMMEEFRDDKVKLVESDNHAIEIFHTIGRNKVAAVLDIQQYLIRRAKEQDEVTENEFYSLMKECVLQDHLLASKEVQQFARSCNYLFMVEKRLWHLVQLKNCVLTDLPSETRLHRTSERLVNCTTWPGGSKMVISEPHFPTDTLSLDLSEFESSQITEKLLSAHPKPEDTTEEIIESKSPPLQPTTVDLMRSMYDVGKESSIFSVVKMDAKHIKKGSVMYDTKLAEKSGDETPQSAEEGFYQVSPILLRKVLMQLQTDQIKWNFDKMLEDDNAWIMRTKWKSEWYPEAAMFL